MPHLSGGKLLHNMSPNFTAIRNWTFYLVPYPRERKHTDLFWLNDPWHQGAYLAVRLPSGRFPPIPTQARAPQRFSTETASSSSVTEDTETPCSNPADCCVAFCCAAPVLPLLADWLSHGRRSHRAAATVRAARWDSSSRPWGRLMRFSPQLLQEDSWKIKKKPTLFLASYCIHMQKKTPKNFPWFWLWWMLLPAQHWVRYLFTFLHWHY